MAFEDYKNVFEFRGVDQLYAAEVTADEESGITFGTPFLLAHVAEVGKTVATSSTTTYYDNQPMIIINSEGADTITLTVAPLTMKVLADITGKSFDDTLGMMVDGPRTNKYYALLYRTKGTDGGYRYVARLKGTFAIPDETSHTENDGTDTNNTTLTYTGINTIAKFKKGQYDAANSKWIEGTAKGVVVDARYNLADVTDWFTTVHTPDTVAAITAA